MKRLLPVLAIVSLSSPANAAMVAAVKITSGLTGVPLQITELIATQTGTGVDVAAASNGATVDATPEYTGAGGNPVAAKAIDGLFADQSFPNMYHGGDNGPGQFLTVTFSQAYALSGLTIYGRSDCCSNQVRDVYIYHLLDGVGAEIGSGTLDANNTSHMASVSLGVVPDAASWTMMAAGFGILGGALRNRRRTTPRLRNRAP